MLSTISRAVGKRLATYLSKSLPGYRRLDTVPMAGLAAVLRKGDILLVEGDSRISRAIKYLTQSSWSHSALFIGEPGDAPDKPNLIEADLREGVRCISLDHYQHLNLRICRAVGLTEADKQALIDSLCAKLGHQYDLKNIIDLLRYLIQKPAVPDRFRRAMIGFGSGEPTRAICSTLIAEAFQELDYPILPVHDGEIGEDGEVPGFYHQHFTHFTPRDFDLSPYFAIVKPTLEAGFDHRKMQWLEWKQD